MKPNKALVPLTLTALLLASCSQDQVGEAAGGWLDEAGEQVGVYDDAGGRHVIVVHPGFAPTEHLLADVEVAVERAAADGATLDVLLLTDANAASAEQVVLPNRGELAMVGGNDPARRTEQTENVRSVMEAITTSLSQATPLTESTGADLFGAVVGAAATASSADNGRGVVTVVTGGGLHRTDDVDLLKAHEDAIGAEQVAAELPIVATIGDIELDVRGAGLFPGLNPAPAKALTELITETWIHWCESRADALTTCRINGVDYGGGR